MVGRLQASDLLGGARREEKTDDSEDSSAPQATTEAELRRPSVLQQRGVPPPTKSRTGVKRLCSSESSSEATAPTADSRKRADAPQLPTRNGTVKTQSNASVKVQQSNGSAREVVKRLAPRQEEPLQAKRKRSSQSSASSDWPDAASVEQKSPKAPRAVASTKAPAPYVDTVSEDEEEGCDASSAAGAGAAMVHEKSAASSCDVGGKHAAAPAPSSSSAESLPALLVDALRQLEARLESQHQKVAQRLDAMASRIQSLELVAKSGPGRASSSNAIVSAPASSYVPAAMTPSATGTSLVSPADVHADSQTGSLTSPGNLPSPGTPGKWSAICSHGIRVNRCPTCSNGAKCSHGKVRLECPVCNCPHGKRFYDCIQCYSCAHGVLRRKCELCKCKRGGQVKS